MGKIVLDYSPQHKADVRRRGQCTCEVSHSLIFSATEKKYVLKNNKIVQQAPEMFQEIERYSKFGQQFSNFATNCKLIFKLNKQELLYWRKDWHNFELSPCEGLLTYLNLLYAVSN